MMMFPVANLAETIAARTLPAITIWNRLEGRPRTEKFDRALKAEIRDALWMLTRQWQMGEFRGDDAGSPVAAKIQLTSTRLRKYQPHEGTVTQFDDSVPLETRVEHRRVAMLQGDREISLDLRLLMGRHWLKLTATSIGDFNSDFIARYPIHNPDPTQLGDSLYCAHPEVWSSFAAVSGRRMDGGKLYLHLKADAANHAYDGIPALAGNEFDVDALAARFVSWFEKLISQPAGDDAWIPERLEYQFSASAPESDGEKVLTADEYFHGHLDWYNVDIDPKRSVLGEPMPPSDLPATITRAIVPTQVTFEGMPNTRWWAFEDGRTNFGDIKPDTTDLAKLMLIEFGLIYANDWFLLPYQVPFGSIVDIKGMAVTNVFGERTWINAAGSGVDDDWQRWAMFLLNIKGQSSQAADTSLLLLPVAAKVHEGPLLEEVMLVRDEIANMVWGVEKTIPLPSGTPKSGTEAARETRVFFEQDVERRLGAPPSPPLLAENAKIRYQLMNTVPENWVPFVPVHVDDIREIQLQRAAMPRILEGDTNRPKKVRPRTQLLREGLDLPAPQAYMIHEEEVSRAGIVVSQRFQRTRWHDGRVWVWLGVRKHTGRGEGSSGLAFDRVVDASGRTATS